VKPATSFASNILYVPCFRCPVFPNILYVPCFSVFLLSRVSPCFSQAQARAPYSPKNQSFSLLECLSCAVAPLCLVIGRRLRSGALRHQQQLFGGLIADRWVVGRLLLPPWSGCQRCHGWTCLLAWLRCRILRLRRHRPQADWHPTNFPAPFGCRQRGTDFSPFGFFRVVGELLQSNDATWAMEQVLNDAPLLVPGFLWLAWMLGAGGGLIAVVVLIGVAVWPSVRGPKNDDQTRSPDTSGPACSRASIYTF
jgi:hypothetical protein